MQMIQNFTVETTYDANGKALMTSVFKNIKVEFGYEKVIVVAFKGWYSTDKALAEAKKLRFLK